MKLEETSEINVTVLAYLKRGKKNQPPIALPDTAPDPYYRQGSHPEVVERVWDQIGSSLPTDCRCLVYGSPALVHLSAGIIFAVSMGTVYCLRLNSKLIHDAQKLGVKTQIKWAGGQIMDAHKDLGSDWVLGGWFADEKQWCNIVYEELGTS
jgi:hypothetical protein